MSLGARVPMYLVVEILELIAHLSERPKILKIENVKDTGKMELLYITGGNVKYSNHLGKQFAYF